MDQSHDRAVWSETVAGTADAQAKNSEQRVGDAEARAARARANEENKRRKVEQETRLEDELEAQLIAAGNKLAAAREAVGQTIDEDAGSSPSSHSSHSCWPVRCYRRRALDDGLSSNHPPSSNMVQVKIKMNDLSDGPIKATART